MAYTVPTAYPTTTALDVVVGHTPVDQDEWDSVVQRQHFVYRHRRTMIASRNLERVRGSDITKLGFQSSSLTSTNPFLYIPATATLWTPDDYDATCELIFWARYQVTGGGGTKGFVRLVATPGPVTGTMSKTPAGFAWESVSMSVTKNLSGLGLALHAYTDNVGTTVEVRQILIYVDEQGAVGV